MARICQKAGLLIFLYFFQLKQVDSLFSPSTIAIQLSYRNSCSLQRKLSTIRTNILFRSSGGDICDASPARSNNLQTYTDLPTPLNKIVDVNIERNSIVYELVLGRDLGIEIAKSKAGSLVVDKVHNFVRNCPVSFHSNSVNGLCVTFF